MEKPCGKRWFVFDVFSHKGLITLAYGFLSFSLQKLWITSSPSSTSKCRKVLCAIATFKVLRSFWLDVANESHARVYGTLTQ